MHEASYPEIYAAFHVDHSVRHSRTHQRTSQTVESMHEASYSFQELVSSSGARYKLPTSIEDNLRTRHKTNLNTCACRGTVSVCVCVGVCVCVLVCVLYSSSGAHPRDDLLDLPGDRSTSSLATLLRSNSFPSVISLQAPEERKGEIFHNWGSRAAPRSSAWLVAEGKAALEAEQALATRAGGGGGARGGGGGVTQRPFSPRGPRDQLFVPLRTPGIR